MNHTELISLILNLVFGAGFLTTFITLKQTKQKAKSEVDKTNVDLASQSVTEMLKSVTSLMKQNKELIEVQTTLQHDNFDLKKRLEKLEKVHEENKEMQQSMVGFSVENRDLRKRVDTLEKKVNCMTKLNREVLKAIEKLGIDESLINLLKQHSE